MRTLRSALLAVTCGLLGVRTAVQAHVGTTVFPIYEIPPWVTIDVRDGSLEDWAQVAPGPSMTSAHDGDFDEHQVMVSAAPNPANMNIRLYLAWSREPPRIYAGFERFDDFYHPYLDGHPDTLWTSFDAVGLSVDGDHSGGQYVFGFRRDLETMSEEEARRRTWRQAQRYAAAAESPDGRQLTGGGDAFGFSDWIAVPPYGDAGGYTEDAADQNPLPFDWPYHRSVIELYVTPWDSLDWRGPGYSLATPLQAGQVIGFHPAAMDPDNRADWREYFHQPRLTLDSYRTADDFIDGLLLPCGVCADPPTAIARQSWARIKAGLR